MHFLCRLFVLLVLTVGLGCGGDSPTDPEDSTPPDRVQDLSATSIGPGIVSLHWSTPGDNGSQGRASYYELRAAMFALAEASWDSATVVDAGRPLNAGQADSTTISGLAIGTWFFGVRVADEVPNWSSISNVPSVDVTGAAPPATILDLSVVSVTASSVLLAWTTPATEGSAVYDVRYSTDELTEAAWATAAQAAGEPAPGDAGSAESFLVSGLTPGSAYSFGIKTANQAPNWSELSNTVSATTTGEIRLTTSSRLIGAREPDWSPDGTRIVLSADWVDQFQLRLYLIPAQGGTPTLFSQIGFGRFPSWSPSSDRIAFVSEREGDEGTVFELSTVDANPSAMPQILASHEPLHVEDPAWSPDGTRIAYQVLLQAFPPLREIYVVPVGGGEPELVVGADRNGEAPAWSPDGTKLVVASNAGTSSDLWIVNLDAGGELQLTTSVSNEITPAWSPDGSRIAYSSNEGGDYDIWVVPTSGVDPVRLTTGTDDEYSPIWSSDGTAITFVRSRGSVSDLWTIYP